MTTKGEQEVQSILSQSRQTMEDDAATRVAIEARRAYPEAAEVELSGQPDEHTDGELLTSAVVRGSQGELLGDLLHLPENVAERVQQQIDLDPLYRDLLESTHQHVVTIEVTDGHGSVKA